MEKKINNIKYSSNFSVRFANSIFLLGILFSTLIAIYATYKIKNSFYNNTATFYYLCIIGAILLAISFGFCLRKLNNELKINFSVLLITIVISVYGFETILEFYQPFTVYTNKEISQAREEMANKMGLEYDNRNIRQLINDLNNEGVNITFNVFPGVFVNSNGLDTESGKIFPFGGISNTITHLGNESGYYPIIETDEYGFNNPKGLYDKEVDILLIGDSFIEGQTVESFENIGAVLREFGFNAISVGKSGTGSIIQYAILKEYAKPLKPKIVLWFFYENDIADIGVEKFSSVLKKYLNDDNFTQNLISRQNEINQVLINFINTESNNLRLLLGENELEGWEKKNINEYLGRLTKERNPIIKIIKLYNFRSRIGLYPQPLQNTQDFNDFKKIINKSLETISGWNGQLYLVYLPSFQHSLTNSSPMYEFFLSTANELNIPTIDIFRQAFAPHSDTLSLFPFRMNGHYNAKGYHLVAEAINNKLKKDGIIPLASNK